MRTRIQTIRIIELQAHDLRRFIIDHLQSIGVPTAGADIELNATEKPGHNSGFDISAVVTIVECEKEV